MHPSQVSQDYINKYGPYTIKQFNIGPSPIRIAQFNMMPSRAHLSREFGLADVLRNKEAIKLTNSLLNTNDVEDIPLTEWEKVGQLEKLPEYEPTPPDLLRNLKSNLQASDFSNIIWDQTTVDLVSTALIRLRDTNVLANQPNAYTLFEGPPGTSKSKVSRIVSALLNRPLYSLNAEQVSPETLASKITGELTIVGNPSTCAQNLARIGFINNPNAKRTYLELLTQKRFEAITLEEWKDIAAKEGLEQGSLYTVPGLSQLAKKYGGIFNIEELNCLRGDGFTLLTVNVLDVYDQDNPNYYVMANMNPTSELHHNRTALPVEIADRFGQSLPVSPLNNKQTTDMLMCMFTGFQPTVKYKDKIKKFSNADFGINTPHNTEKVLTDIFTSETLSRLAHNLSEFQHTIISHIDEGILNRATSQVPNVLDHTILTRRGLSLFTQGLMTELVSLSKADISNETTITQQPTLDLSRISFNNAVDAISNTLNEYYVKPYSFNIDKTRLNVALSQTGNVSPNQVESTSVLINDVIKRCKLDPTSLKEYVQLKTALKKSEAEFNKILEKGLNLSPDLINKFKETKQYKETIESFNEWSKEHKDYDIDSQTSKIFSINKINTTTLEQKCPELISRGSTNTFLPNSGVQKILSFYSTIFTKHSTPLELKDLEQPSLRNKLITHFPTDEVVILPLISDPKKAFTPANSKTLVSLKNVKTTLIDEGLTHESTSIPNFLSYHLENDKTLLSKILSNPLSMIAINSFNLPLEEISKLNSKLPKKQRQKLNWEPDSKGLDI